MINKINFFLTDIQGMPEDSKARKRLEDMLNDCLRKCESEKDHLKCPRRESEQGLTFCFD
jgi:hypothetical protein